MGFYSISSPSEACEGALLLFSSCFLRQQKRLDDLAKPFTIVEMKWNEKLGSDEWKGELCSIHMHSLSLVIASLGAFHPKGPSVHPSVLVKYIQHFIGKLVKAICSVCL